MSVGKEKINVLSLFDGISCGQIALERQGIEIENYFASEIDKHAIKVTQANYPNTKQLGSVIDVKAKDLPKIDLLIGGSPCQGFSIAGKKLNFDDDRSKLFFEFVRLKNELNPKYFLLENVRMTEDIADFIEQLLKEASEGKSKIETTQPHLPLADVNGIYNIPKMKTAKKELLKRITAIFDKYEISKSERSQLHNMIRGVGMIKLRIKNTE